MLKCQMSNINYQILDDNKVKLLSERTSGVPPVIFNSITHSLDIPVTLVWVEFKL